MLAALLRSVQRILIGAAAGHSRSQCHVYVKHLQSVCFCSCVVA